ncbi:MAG: 23S rRNA (uracil(1939)-C(5))-methyltransferase RlmD [Candidatus Omnitrophota bacterium]
MRITIEKIVFTGKSLGRTDEGKVVLTDEGIPGEILEVSPVREKKNYIEAKTQCIIRASGARQAPRCGHYRTCAPYQYIDYDTQLEIKKSQALEALKEFAGDTVGKLAVRPSPKIWNYRNRLRLHIIRGPKGAHFAYHKPGKTGSFEGIDGCHLADEGINRFLSSVKEDLRKPLFRNVTEITVRISSHSGELLCVLHGGIKGPDERLGAYYENLKDCFPLAGLVFMDKKNERTTVYGKARIEEILDGKRFAIGPTSFFQINTPQIGPLITDMRENIPLTGKEKIIDLYAGVGLFSIILAPGAASVSSVELSGESVALLRDNILANNAGNVYPIEGDCEKLAGTVLGAGWDIAVLDPPRTGLGPGLCGSLMNCGIKHLVYVSCDPATMARDLGVLTGGYAARRVFAYDFFPHTTHIETMAILERR